jgi:hypothetical protein
MLFFKNKPPAMTGARISEKRPQPTADQSSSDDASSSSSSHSSTARATRSRISLPGSLQWIPKAWTWSNIKAVIRCAVVAWVSSLLIIVPRVQLVLGQVHLFREILYFLVANIVFSG